MMYVQTLVLYGGSTAQSTVLLSMRPSSDRLTEGDRTERCRVTVVGLLCMAHKIRDHHHDHHQYSATGAGDDLVARVDLKRFLLLSRSVAYPL